MHFQGIVRLSGKTLLHHSQPQPTLKRLHGDNRAKII
jgi:hypothetical protein